MDSVFGVLLFEPDVFVISWGHLFIFFMLEAWFFNDDLPNRR